MIVDACAAVAYFDDEPTADMIEGILADAPLLLMSSVTLTECCLVLSRLGVRTPAQAREAIEAARIEIVPVDSEQAVLAAEGRRRYPIRFGDAFVYALARARNLPVLTLDAELRKTDVDLVPLSGDTPGPSRTS